MCTWLDRDFYNRTFSAAEKDAVLNTEVDSGSYNYDVSQSGGCVRPALWIDLESDLFD